MLRQNFLKLALLALLIVANVSTSLAADPSTTPTTAAAQAAPGVATYRTFHVGKYLTVTNFTDSSNTVQGIGTQGQAYLCKGGDTKSCNPLLNFILFIINTITLVVASLSFFAIVVAGIFMITSAGDQNRLNRGKDIMRLAITGLIITLSAYFIIAFVQSLLFETAAK